MAIHFTHERMKAVLENHEKWWNGTLDRPLVKMTLTDAYEAEGAEKAPLLSQANCTDFSWTAEEIVEAMDRELSKYEFLGDAFPMINFDSFGPGVLAAMCGAKLDNSSGAVWFFPEEEKEISEIHVHYDPENVWSRRIKEIYRAGLKKWNGLVLMGFPDLGGVMDVAASFRGSENLLIDMLEEPDEVKRLVKEIEIAWHEAYEDFRSVLEPQGAYTHWSGLASYKTSYIIQSDLTYMVGNQMFREFVLDTLKKDADKLHYTIYHLDGVGELNHLDSVLSIEKLNAVQWQFGDGKPQSDSWIDVYQKILASGKQIMIEGKPENYLKTLSVLHGTPYYKWELSAKDRAFAEKVVAAR